VRKWAVVFEKAEHNYSAYVPDLPGCIATGATIEENKSNLGEAIDLHLEMMRADGDEIPEPATLVDLVEHDVTVAAKRS
jgi:predicted RNase H-like HicB family nuclease